MRYLCSALLVGLITFASSCTTSDRKEADRKAAAAKAKAQQAARETGHELKRLGQDAKTEARQFDASAHRALQGGGATPASGSESLQPKLGQAAEKTRVAGHEATVAVDRATLIARVKSKLAADAGLSTLANVSVDTSGHVVTLKGTVNSEQQKRLAEEAAIQVDGVSKVVDELTVRP
jgi:osmotically-inducible protein OsmY